MSKEIEKDQKEILKHFDSSYEIFKDKIPNIFNERYKLLTCLIGVLVCYDISIEEEEDFIKRAQKQIDELQKNLDTLKVYLKEYREEGLENE